MKECSSIVQSFHRRRYQVFYKGRGRGPTWQESRKACQALGGDLAEFKNRQEQDKIENAIIKWPTGRYAAYWIGIEKGSGEDAVWISGEKVEFNSDLMFSSFNTLNEKSTRDKFGVIDREGIRDSWGWGFLTAGYVCEFASNESMDEGVEICNIDNDDHNDNEDNNNEDNSDNKEPPEWVRWMLEDNNDNNEDNSNNEDNNNNKDNYVNEDPIVITYSYDHNDNEDNNNYEDNKTQ